mmetsp:Transcript_18695/g.28401  ORF Transcript_18695/g.28401 Transcript_18695/m.28401 type:complete len:615 (+) Transcript_18695:143-1987(+)
MSSPASSKTSSSSKRKGRRVRCGECPACVREDCGVCIYCLRKKKFGGDGSSKDACIHRKCKNLQERNSSKKQKHRSSRDEDGDDDGLFCISNQDEPILCTVTNPMVMSVSTNNSVTKITSPAAAENRKSPRGRPLTAIQIKPSNDIKGAANDYVYGRPKPTHPLNECAGCLGKRSKELKATPILLCDGCDREFHLDCCLPPIIEVPSGIYFCFDCSDTGSTHLLESYFEEHHEKRAEYNSSFEFVKAALDEHLAQEEDQEVENSCHIPQSELSRLSKLHYDAIIWSTPHLAKSSPKGKRSTGKSQPSPNMSPLKKLGPEFLLGKCIRLYCPVGNQYHSGRIVDWRRANFCNEFWESEVDDVEYLVRFPAGKDYRKTVYRQWLILEEHSLAVGSTLIWGMNFPRKGVSGWNPGQTWLRTSLEMFPVQKYLSQKQNQIYNFDDKVGSEDRSWALVSFWGEDEHHITCLRDESVDFFSASFAHARNRRQPTTGAELDGRLNVYMGLAQIEWEEQERIRGWKRLPLNNPIHLAAIRLHDETSLEPCMQRKRDPSLCPSINIDFDRLYLLNKISSKPSLEMGFSLVCELAPPSPTTIKELQEQQNKITKDLEGKQNDMK